MGRREEAHARVSGAGGDLGGQGGVSKLLPVIAVDPRRIHAVPFAQVVDENPGARAFLAVDVSQPIPEQVLQTTDAQGVPGGGMSPWVRSAHSVRRMPPLGKYFLIKAGLRVSLLPLWSKSGVLTSAASLARFLDREDWDRWSSWAARETFSGFAMVVKYRSCAICRPRLSRANIADSDVEI